MSDFSSGTTGASFCLIVSHVQEVVLKNLCFFTSSAPPVPSLEDLGGGRGGEDEREREVEDKKTVYPSARNLAMRSLALSPT